MNRLDMREKIRYVSSIHGMRYVFGILVLIVILFSILRIRNQSAYAIDFQDQRMVISGPESTEPVSADYREIRSVTLLDGYSAGIAVSGISQRGLTFGRFQNDAYGTYFLCAVPSVKTAIEIRTDSETIVFNYESSEVTAALSRALSDLVVQKQQ